MGKHYSFHNNYHTHSTLPTTNHQSINMSAPNVDAPNEGIVGQAVNSVKNAANYVSETIQGNAAEASKEANKEQAKGNVGDTTMSGRASGALGAASDTSTRPSTRVLARPTRRLSKLLTLHTSPTTIIRRMHDGMELNAGPMATCDHINGVA